MSLLGRTQSLEARAKRQGERDKREQLAGEVRARTKNLEKHLSQLAATSARADALREAEQKLSQWPPPPMSAFEAYDPNGDALSTDASRKAEWEKFVLALGKFVETTSKLVTQDLKRTKKSALEGITEEELRGYLADPSSQRQVQALLDTFLALEQKNWEGLAGPDLRQILALARAFRDEVVRQRETGASAELLRFLTLARKDGASLTSLTGPLRAELEERQLLSRLRLVIK
jgi:hypothetical protein